ncbi:MAG: HDOD domain-containing protein [Planctomycetota bacterium]
MNIVLPSQDAPPEHLREALMARADDLAMLPSVAMEALQLVKRPDCTSQEFAAVVERDVKLATDFIALANCVVFGGGAVVTNLRQAIVRLGFRQCQNLILTSSAASLMRSMPLAQEWAREVLWKHSFTTATTCSHLNRALNLGFCGEEFTAGLLHDFGRLLLALAAPELQPAADPLDFVESADTFARELEVLGTDHCLFGAWFATENGIPPALVEVIRYHHEPLHAQIAPKLTLLVAAADHMANHLQVYEEPEGYVLAENTAIQQLAKFEVENVGQSFSDIAFTLMEEVLKDVESYE